MIYFDPVNGPAEADLTAIELRRSDDRDIQDLLAVIRRMVPDDDTLKEKVEELKGEVEDLKGEIEDLQEENSDLRGENEAIRRGVKKTRKRLSKILAEPTKTATTTTQARKA